MGAIAEIQQMIKERLAFKLSLKKEEYDYLIFSDKKHLLFTRIMLLFGFSFALAMLFVIQHKFGKIPMIPMLVLCFFALAFFIMLLFKLFTHKELLIEKSSKKMRLHKKSFSKILKERIIEFSQIKFVKIETVARKERIDNDSNRTRTNIYVEIFIELKSGETIYFSSVNDAEIALPLAEKIANFIDAPLKNEL
ncbi:MAG: hypothetical protein V4667_09415 [Bacteroidota bacterium]